MKIFLLLFPLIIFFSCEKEVNTPDNKNVREINQSVNYNLTIEVGTRENLLSYLNSGGLKAAIASPEGFVSMNELVCKVDETLLDNVENIEDYGAKEKIRFYDLLEYEELVPNETLSGLLNTKGEITVENTLFRITEYGTFYCDPSLQGELDSFYTEVTQVGNNTLVGTYIDNQTIKVKDGIYLIDTYRALVPELTDSVAFYYPELDGYEVAFDNSIPVYQEGFNIPGIDRFPKFKSGAKTVAGKILSGLFGDNSFKTVKLSSKRKLNAKLYDYNYGVYYEMGAYAIMKKKNWIGWSGTNADELVLGWRNVILELDTKVPNMPILPAPTYVGSFSTQIPGFDKEGVCLSILGLDINNGQLLAALKAGKQPLINWLKANVSNGSSIGRIDPSSLFLANQSKVYVIVVDQDIRAYKKESIRKVFASGMSFYFSIDLMNMPNNLLSWAKTMKDIGKLPVKSLKDGEVVCAGRLGNNWAGMIITKE